MVKVFLRAGPNSISSSPRPGGNTSRTMPSPNLILVTGSAGRIGQAVVRELTAQRLAVRGFDRAPMPGLPDSVVGDITDPTACRRATAGVTTLVHLAATPDDVDDPVRDRFP